MMELVTGLKSFMRLGRDALDGFGAVDESGSPRHVFRRDENCSNDDLINRVQNIKNINNCGRSNNTT
jgi:hypothetical protein